MKAPLRSGLDYSHLRLDRAQEIVTVSLKQQDIRYSY